MDKADLKEDIEVQLANLERLAREMEELRGRYTQEPDFIGIRAAASILHDFYCGVEKIFERIALSIDKNLPGGQDWHTSLLSQMATPVAGIRKEVIGEELLQKLKQYLRFRHLFRNIYGFELKWARFADLTASLEDLRKRVKSALDSFFGGLIY